MAHLILRIFSIFSIPFSLNTPLEYDITQCTTLHLNWCETYTMFLFYLSFFAASLAQIAKDEKAMSALFFLVARLADSFFFGALWRDSPMIILSGKVGGCTTSA